MLGRELELEPELELKLEREREPEPEREPEQKQELPPGDPQLQKTSAYDLSRLPSPRTRKCASSISPAQQARLYPALDFIQSFTTKQTN